MKEEQILNSAKELFLIYGYKKVSMTEIAERAQITKKTLYSYFKDKTDLLNHLIIEEIKHTKDVLEEIESESLEFLDKVHKAIYTLLEYRKNNKFLSIITKEYELDKSNQLKDSLKILDKSIKDYIYNKTVLAMEKGYIKKCNPEIVAFIIYKVYVALMFEWNEEQEPLDDSEISNNISNILKNGLLNKEDE